MENYKICEKTEKCSNAFEIMKTHLTDELFQYILKEYEKF